MDTDSDRPRLSEESESETTPLLRREIPRESESLRAILCRALRFLASEKEKIFLICFLGFGAHLCKHNPSALEAQMRNDTGLNDTELYNLDTRFIYWPNSLLPIFGGFLMDWKLGRKSGAVVFAFLVVVGQFILAIGAFTGKFWIMMVGRIIFGIGGESLEVASYTYIVTW